MDPSASRDEARYRIVHRIVYRFAEAVRDVKLELMLTPEDGPTQSIEHHQLIVDPHARTSSGGRDAWGNAVAHVEVEGATTMIEIAAVTTVRTRTSMAAASAEARIRPLLVAAGFEGSPRASAPGRCRALTEALLARLAERGIAARYVAGYLLPTAGERTDAHAWASVPIDDGGIAAVDFDPTLDAPTGARHVRIAVGAGYEDVAPVRGALVGSGRYRLDSAVHVERLRR